MNFFSEFQSKFPSKYSGQYLEAIIKSIANFELNSQPSGVPLILVPIFNRLEIEVIGVNDLTVDSEVQFKGKGQKRRADLVIEFMDSINHPHVIYVEIKVDDDIIKAKNATVDDSSTSDQLDDYLTWLEGESAVAKHFLILTAHPLDFEHMNKLRKFPETAHHLYFGDYFYRLNIREISADSMINMFRMYLTEEGYVMYQPNKDDTEDFLSYMALNFLVHSSGHGRVVSNRKISNGPIVFAGLVKNWQLTSARINAVLKTKGVPAVRYLPEQVLDKVLKLNVNDKNESYTFHRMKMRKNRDFGRMWLVSDVSVHDKKAELTWGLIYSIANVNRDDPMSTSIQCRNFVSLRSGKDLYKEVVGADTPFDVYSKKGAEDVVSDLMSLIEEVDKSALEHGIYPLSIIKS